MAHKRKTVFPGSDPDVSLKESVSLNNPTRDRLENGWTPSLTSKRTRIEHKIGTSPQLTYHEFMVLGQAGSANMGCDNTRDHNFVAIKRLKGIDKSSTHRMRPFKSDHVVNIRDMYFDNDDLVIIYEQMDKSLRGITDILQGPFQPFQIAAICKEVSTSPDCVSLALLTRE